MSSPKRIRAARWLHGDGIEIGALHAPLELPGGAAVQYVDRAPVEVLRTHYRELAGEELVPISIIGDAHDLSALPDGSVDFVIANHLLEHLENPIGGLQEMLRVIRAGGILYVALPDPRVTFDVDRPLTSVGHVVDEFLHGTEATRRAHFEEWVALAEQHVQWMQEAGVATGPERVDELMEMDYSIHFHLWRPDTFLDFIAAARQEANLELELVDFESRRPDDDEYIFVFAKGTRDSALPVPPLPEEVGTCRLRAAVDALASQKEDLERSLAALSSSRSWRITAPMRAVNRRLLTLARRG